MLDDRMRRVVFLISPGTAIPVASVHLVVNLDNVYAGSRDNAA